MATNNRNNYQPTNHAVQVGSTNGGLTSLSVGTTGQLMVGNSAADPAFSASANADITFGGANSGATRTLTCSNTSNTSTSAANLLVTVGGGTAADATHQAVVNGVTTWTWGVDNSDSDAFVTAASTALGTTNVMRVATTGEINYPLQSCFITQKSNGNTNVTGDGTVYTYISNSEIVDQNNDYDGTSTYTAPITGRVFLCQNFISSDYVAAATNGNSSIVTSNRTYKLNTFNFGALFGSLAFLGFGGSILADMDAGDTATNTLTISNTTKRIDVSGTIELLHSGGFIAC